jgi:hypothetical protein
VLAYHGGSDPFANFNGNNILSTLGFSSYPTGIIGRVSGIQSRSSWAGWVNVVSSDYSAGVSYSWTKSYNPSNRQLTVNLTATALRNIDTVCYINLVLYEDNIIYPQAGNESCQGGTNYVHTWVVRNMVNGALGEILHSAPWQMGQTANKTWVTTIDAGWVAENVTVAVFAYLQTSNLQSGSPVQQTKKETMIPTGVGNQNNTPLDYSLSQNYPNPFNPSTNIKFTLPKDGEASLKIYDAIGNEVAVYLEGFVKAGTYNAVIDGSNLASGVYFYTLRTKDFTETKKMTLVK